MVCSMKKKKVIKWITAIVIVGAIGGAGYYYRNDLLGMIPFLQAGKSADKVYVERISKIMNTYTGNSNRYNGIVEAQDSYEVNVDSSRTVKEVLVKVGDAVEEGQQLLTYDVSDVEMQIKQANLDLEGIQNEIDGYNRQITMLNEELAKTTDESDRFSLSVDIQAAQNAIEQTRIDMEGKQLEIQKLKEQTADASVISKKTGVVKEINEEGVDSNGNTAAFMKIMQTGEYRIKGSIDEQNVWMLNAGQDVVIRSRVDEKQTWNGTIARLDTQNVSQDENDYDGSEGGAFSATKYPFYIDLKSSEGLLLGQHVYIEMDQGQEQPKEGLWLYADYIVKEEGENAGAYVWAANEKNRLEMRKVELGEYDEELGEYQILSGVDKGDYIAWPMKGLYEGVSAVTSMDEVDYSSPLYENDTEMPYEEDYEEEYMDDMDMEDTEWLLDTEWMQLPSEEEMSTESIALPQRRGAQEILDSDVDGEAEE